MTIYLPITPAVLIVPVRLRVVPVSVEAVSVFTFAIVVYKGNPNVFTIIQVFESYDVNVRPTPACDVCMLLVPSRKRVPPIVLTMIVWGVDK